MKYFLLLLFLTISIISVTGKIPDYIKVCKRKDPEINMCVRNSILSLREMLGNGIPELGVQSIDPLHLKKAGLDLGPGFHADVHNLILRGAKNFKIHDLDVNPEANVCSFSVLIPEITANATYEIDARIASIPLKGNGPLYASAKSVKGRGVLRGKNVVRGGKTYNWFPSMSLKFEVGDYDVKLVNLFDGDPTIEEATNRLLNEHKMEVLASFLPLFEEPVIEYILLSSNNIAKHFTWDELFPDS